MKKYAILKLLFALCLGFQILTLICYGTSNRFSGSSFDGFSAFSFIQSESGDFISSNKCFSGGSFDGYAASSFIQSESGNFISSNKCYSGGSFDGYAASSFIQSESGNFIPSNKCYSGGSYDGYDNDYFEYPVPFIEITNAPDFLLFAQTTAQISGTNNFNVLGQLGWLNNGVPGVTNWFDQGFSVEVNGLAEGSNVITIIGINSLGIYGRDSVIIYRETFEDVHPFIQITNVPAIVAFNVSSAEISGTNLNIAGQLGIINDQYPETTNFFAQGFFTTISNLEHGDNLITIFGTNIYGHSTNDVISIHRETFAEVYPFIDITNENATVTYSVTSYTIGGTNNANVVGGMNWANSLGGSGSIPVSGFGFQVSGISLNVGDNLITVSGTNIYGQSTNDVVSIQRKTLIESEPHIATNALIFPSSNSVLLAPFPTNIIWDIEKITDDIDGTNLTITKISVHIAETTNEVSVVTNDISNLLGEIPWLVPENLIGGDTNYVLKFEVVDSTSLTNSRIFWDNEFLIIPEPGIILLTLLASFIVWLRRH